MGDVIRPMKWGANDRGQRPDGITPGGRSHAVDEQRETEHEARRQQWREFASRYGVRSGEGRQNLALSEADQTRVARALYRVMARAEEERRTTKATIMRDAGIAREGDSTKHLAQYTAKPGSTKHSQRGLNKKVRPYLSLARSAAQLAGWDEAIILEEVFGETSLADRGHPRVASPAFEALAVNLHDICSAVAAKHQLGRYFERLAIAQPSLSVADENPDEIDAMYRVEKSTFIPKMFYREYVDMSETSQYLISDLLWDKCEFDEMPTGTEVAAVQFGVDSRDGVRDFDGEVPSFPVVVLGQWAVGSAFPVKVHSQSWFDSREGTEDVVRAVTRGQLEVEVRLCIVPQGSGMAPRPALRLKPLLEVDAIDMTTRKRWDDIDSNSATKVTFMSTSDFVDAHYCDGVSEKRERHMCRLAFDLPEKLAFSLKYFDKAHWRVGGTAFPRFFAVRGDVVEDWLGSNCSDWGKWEPAKNQKHLIVLGPPIVGPFSGGINNNAFSPVPKGTPAHVVDESVLGLHELDLVKMLDERAERLIELLDRSMREAAHDRDAAWSALQSRLTKMRRDSGITS